MKIFDIKHQVEISINTTGKTEKQIEKEIRKHKGFIRDPEVKLKVNFIK